MLTEKKGKKNEEEKNHKKFKKNEIKRSKRSKDETTCNPQASVHLQKNTKKLKTEMEKCGIPEGGQKLRKSEKISLSQGNNAPDCYKLHETQNINDGLL